jgi:tetratricopeptide (TPR) repeat protein
MQHRSGWLLAAGLAAAALIHDPSAPAASAKTPLLLLCAVAWLALVLPAIGRGDRPSATPGGYAWGLVFAGLAFSLRSGGAPLALALPAAGLVLSLAGAGLEAEARAALASRVAMLVLLGSGAATAWQLARGAPLHGLHGNPDWLGLCVVAALPLACHRLRAPMLVPVVVGVATLLASQSRSAWAGALVAAVLLLRGRPRALALGGGAVAVAAAVWFTDVGAAWQGRLWIWRHAWRALAEAPILGHGAGRFGFAYLDAQGQSLAALPLDVAAARFSNATTAHHDALHLAVEAGAPVSLALLAAFAFTAWRLRERWPAGAASLAAVAVAGLGDVALLQPAVVCLSALVLSAAPLEPRRSDGLFALVALAAAAALLPEAIGSWTAERRLTRARAAPLAERRSILTQAAAQAPRHGELALELGLTHLALGDAEAALPWLGRSRARFANVGTDVAAGNAELALGHDDEAIAAFERALAWHPARFAAQLNLAEALRRRGDLEGARAHLAAARDLQPNHPKLRALADALRRSEADAATRPGAQGVPARK